MDLWITGVLFGPLEIGPRSDWPGRRLPGGPVSVRAAMAVAIVFNFTIDCQLFNTTSYSFLYERVLLWTGPLHQPLYVYKLCFWHVFKINSFHSMIKPVLFHKFYSTDCCSLTFSLNNESGFFFIYVQSIYLYVYASSVHCSALRLILSCRLRNQAQPCGGIAYPNRILHNTVTFVFFWFLWK